MFSLWGNAVKNGGPKGFGDALAKRQRKYPQIQLSGLMENVSLLTVRPQEHRAKRDRVERDLKDLSTHTTPKEPHTAGRSHRKPL